MNAKQCLDCDIIIYYDEMEPIYCDQCARSLKNTMS